jgi:hypothetical protein
MSEPTQIITPIPIQIRKRFALGYLAKTALIAAILCGLLLYAGAPAEVWFLAVLPLIWGGIVAGKYMLTREVIETTDYGKRVAAEKEEDDLRHAQERDDKWYVRYPIAFLLLAAAWWLASERENVWWLSIVLVVSAAVYAREVSFLLLLALGAYLLFQGIAALPVSVAVIIGAFIIAGAIKK